jgi:release factor glutamine methyltransferase
MKNSKSLFQELVARLTLKESVEEIQGIAYILLEAFFDVSRTDIMAGKAVPYPQEKAELLQQSIERINQGEPVQYVTGEEYFFGRKFQVNPSVLIPRPETEELVRQVLLYKTALTGQQDDKKRLKILDIGTGSGCLPITLFHAASPTDMFATDASSAALSVASANAAIHRAHVTFIEHNILREKLPFTDLDVIISNPPYVTEKEKSVMKMNVLDYEPAIALFVPDNDPLIFYREIAAQAKETLKPGGLLAVEINEKFAKEVSALLEGAGFKEVATINDVAGKPRVVKGLKIRL